MMCSLSIVMGDGLAVRADRHDGGSSGGRERSARCHGGDSGHACGLTLANGMETADPCGSRYGGHGDGDGFEAACRMREIRASCGASADPVRARRKIKAAGHPDDYRVACNR
ncbi:MAG: hypothetical protein ACLUUO_01470 [Sellimonas intestinalis]